MIQPLQLKLKLSNHCNLPRKKTLAQNRQAIANNRLEMTTQCQEEVTSLHSIGWGILRTQSSAATNLLSSKHLDGYRELGQPVVHSQFYTEFFEGFRIPQRTRKSLIENRLTTMKIASD
jgi:hypothetical protein